MKNSIGHKPKEKWEFDEEVTDCFEDMLKRSIPQYEVMRNTVTNIVNRILDENPQLSLSKILDLGCSRGDAIAEIVKGRNKNKFYGFDVSEPMLKIARNRFRYDENIFIHKYDLRRLENEELPINVIGIALSILTIQFIPIEYRQEIIQKIYDNLMPNGCFIMVEKVLGNTSKINSLMTKEYLKLKEDNGYSKEDIERKKLSLEGVLVPATASWNEDLLRQAGFRKVDCFWRWMTFAGWIAIK